MNAYALGFVVACFVGMFVAGIVTDWLDRRADRRAPQFTTTPDADIQLARANAAKARRKANEAYMRWSA